MADRLIPRDPSALQPYINLTNNGLDLSPEQVAGLLKWLAHWKNEPGISPEERQVRYQATAEAERNLMAFLKQAQPAVIKKEPAPDKPANGTRHTNAGDNAIDIGSGVGPGANVGSGITHIEDGVVGGDKVGTQINTEGGDVYYVVDSTVKPLDNLPGKKPDPGLSDAAKAYLTWLYEVARRVPLGKLDLAMSPSDRNTPNIYLKDIFVPLDIKRARREDEIRHISISVLDGVNRQTKLVILGDPGSGKTTLLNFLTMTLAEARLFPDKDHLNRLSLEKTADRAAVNWGHGALLPLRIDLREFVRDIPSKTRRGSANLVWQHVTNRLEGRGLNDYVEELKKEVRKGDALVMFDGLDEIVDLKQRTIVRNAVESFAETYPKSRYLVTCRELSYTGREWQLESFTDVTLAPLTPEGIKSFILRWYVTLANHNILNREEARSKAKELIAATERLSDLSQNPMLLTVMAVVHTYKGHLPRERARLYEDCVRLLLWEWQRAKQNAAGEWEQGIVDELETREERLINGLCEVAFQAHHACDGKANLAHIPQADVERVLRRYLDNDWQKAQRFCQYVEKRAGLLIGKGQDKNGEPVYAFPHRGFQEFLAARSLVNDRDFDRQAAKLARESDVWHEVLRLAVGHLVFNDNNVYRPISAINVMIRHDPPAPDDDAGWRSVWLAGDMLTIVGRNVAEQDDLIGRDATARLMKQLVQLVEEGHLTPIERAQAADILGWLGDPRPGIGTQEPRMVQLDGGTFEMGPGDNRHKVTIKPFNLAAYPVTNSQFRAFARSRAYATDKYWTEAGIQWRKRAGIHGGYIDEPWWGIDNRPAVGVVWHEALAYANWLSAKTRKNYRLPTEAEWEFTAAGIEGRKYPFGNRGSDDTANTREAGVEQTTSVGIFPGDKTPEGIYDMGGNIWQWCSSLEKDYPYKASDGREKLEADGARVLRGGSYQNYRREIHCTQRRGVDPGARVEFIGFPAGNGHLSGGSQNQNGRGNKSSAPVF